MALRRALLPRGAPEHHGLRMPRRQRRAFAHEGAEFGHFGQHHCDHFQRVDLVLRETSRHLRLHDEHAQLLAQPLHRHAEERGIDLLPRLRHVAEAPLLRRVRRVDRLRAEQVDGAHLRLHRARDQLHDPVEPRLSRRRARHHLAQAPEELPALAFRTVRHGGPGPCAGPPLGGRGRLDHRRRDNGMTQSKARCFISGQILRGEPRSGGGQSPPCAAKPPSRARRRHATPARRAPCTSGRSARKS